MTEISTVQVVPQMKVVKIANGENTGKAYLLNEPINDTVVIEKGEKKGGGFFKGLLSFILPGLGEACDGRGGAALGAFGTFAGITGLSLYAQRDMLPKLKKGLKMTKNAIKSGDAKQAARATKFLEAIKARNWKKHKVAIVVGGIAAVATRIASAINAAKGKKD